MGGDGGPEVGFGGAVSELLFPPSPPKILTWEVGGGLFVGEGLGLSSRTWFFFFFFFLCVVGFVLLTLSISNIQTHSFYEALVEAKDDPDVHVLFLSFFSLFFFLSFFLFLSFPLLPFSSRVLSSISQTQN